MKPALSCCQLPRVRTLPRLGDKTLKHPSRNLRPICLSLPHLSRNLRAAPGTLASARRNLRVAPSTLAPARRNLRVAPGTLASARRNLRVAPSTLAPARRNLRVPVPTLVPASRNLRVVCPRRVNPAQSAPFQSSGHPSSPSFGSLSPHARLELGPTLRVACLGSRQSPRLKHPSSPCLSSHA